MPRPEPPANHHTRLHPKGRGALVNPGATSDGHQWTPQRMGCPYVCRHACRLPTGSKIRSFSTSFARFLYLQAAFDKDDGAEADCCPKHTAVSSIKHGVARKTEFALKLLKKYILKNQSLIKYTFCNTFQAGCCKVSPARPKETALPVDPSTHPFVYPPWSWLCFHIHANVHI